MSDARTDWVALGGAALTAALHLPQMLLTAATTLLARVYVPLFLRHRNVLPLGLVHGWLGTFFYLWALDIDPWARTFGRLGRAIEFYQARRRTAEH